MTDDTDADLEALKRQTSHGDRIDEAARQDETRELCQDVLDYLE